MVDINITCIFQIKHWSAESNKQSWSIRYVYHSVHVASSSKIPFPPLTQQGRISFSVGTTNQFTFTKHTLYFFVHSLLCFFFFYIPLKGLKILWHGGTVKKYWAVKMDSAVVHGWLPPKMVGLHFSPILEKYKIFHNPTLEGTSQFVFFRSIHALYLFVTFTQRTNQ
jgi:hypothetical protein